MPPSCPQRAAGPSAELQLPCCLQATAATDTYRHVTVKLDKPRNDDINHEAPTVDDINHYLKDPKLWELGYIPYNGKCRIYIIHRMPGFLPEKAGGKRPPARAPWQYLQHRPPGLVPWHSRVSYGFR